MFDLSQYETVDQRLEKFWAKYPDGAILTELVAYKDDRFICKASIYKTYADNVPFATGYAEESVSNRGVNSTSALENSESSAIGRALHTGGISKHSEGKPRPSAEEMAKVNAKQSKQEPTTFKEKLADKITIPVEDDPWLTKAVSPAPSAADAIELVQEVLGAVKIDKDIPLCRNCHDHKPMEWKTGVSAKNNKPWGKFSCYVCRDVMWYNIAADGTWKPQEAKA